MTTMKNLLIVTILWATSIPAKSQDFQGKIDNYFRLSDLDSLNMTVKEIAEYNPGHHNRYLTYWEAYGLYKSSLILSEKRKEKREAEEALDKAKELLEATKLKTSEDFALLAMCYNYSLSFANSLKVISLSSETKKLAKTAITEDPNNLRGYLVSGMNDFYTPAIFGGKKDCEEHFLKAIALDAHTSNNPFDPTWGKDEAYYYLVSFYASKDDDESRKKAEKFLTEALELYPDNSMLKRLRNGK